MGDELISPRDVASAFHRFGSLQGDLERIAERLSALETLIEELQLRIEALEEMRDG